MRRSNNFQQQLRWNKLTMVKNQNKLIDSVDLDPIEYDMMKSCDPIGPTYNNYSYSATIKDLFLISHA